MTNTEEDTPTFDTRSSVNIERTNRNQSTPHGLSEVPNNSNNFDDAKKDDETDQTKEQWFTDLAQALEDVSEKIDEIPGALIKPPPQHLYSLVRLEDAYKSRSFPYISNYIR